jgi:hypothetical protein
MEVEMTEGAPCILGTWTSGAGLSHGGRNGGEEVRDSRDSFFLQSRGNATNFSLACEMPVMLYDQSLFDRLAKLPGKTPNIPYPEDDSL